MTNRNNIVVIENQLIDSNKYYQWLSQCPQDGAIVTFTGKVRSIKNDISSLYLEHYQGMTESVLLQIIEQARSRWSLGRLVIIHRVGEILANEYVVYVGVSSCHRKDAFVAAEFIMDILKNDAPFWKKEKTLTSNNWVEVKKSDKDTLKKWY